MIEWKIIRSNDILAAEYQFFGIENSVWIVTYCKDIAFFVHILPDWFFDKQNNKSINQPYIHKE